ncbi:MAG: hypothetical protein K8R37_14190 [Bacteroidales bacterium]|nr:hypothetical protein [Bacteroidales bacterium]
MNELREIEFNEDLINKFLDIDGSLRDIYVNNTDLNDWIKLYDSLLKSEYSVSYSCDHEIQIIPENVELIFNKTDCSHILRVKEENIVFNTHFFIKKQIEFDLDPRDFVAMDQSRILIEFMHFVSDSLNKEVIMTPENDEKFILIKIKPKNRKIYIK